MVISISKMWTIHLLNSEVENLITLILRVVHCCTVQLVPLMMFPLRLLLAFRQLSTYTACCTGNDTMNGMWKLTCTTVYRIMCTPQFQDVESVRLFRQKNFRNNFLRVVANPVKFLGHHIEAEGLHP